MSAIRTIGAKVHEVSTDKAQDCDARVLFRDASGARLLRAMLTRLTHLADLARLAPAQLVALVAPPTCPSCRAALRATRLRLCPACAAALPWLPGRCCPCCALPSHRGRRCPAAGAAFGRAWAPLAYDGVARRLVGALKFRGALPLADLMAAH